MQTIHDKNLARLREKICGRSLQPFVVLCTPEQLQTLLADFPLALIEEVLKHGTRVKGDLYHFLVARHYEQPDVARKALGLVTIGGMPAVRNAK